MAAVLPVDAALYLQDFDTAATELRRAKETARAHADRVREDDPTRYPGGLSSPLWDARLRISSAADIHVAWLEHYYQEIVGRFCHVAVTALTRSRTGQPVALEALRDADNAYRAQAIPLLPPLPTRDQMVALTDGQQFTTVWSAWLAAQEAVDATAEMCELEEALERLADVDRDRLAQVRETAARLWQRAHDFAQAAMHAVVDASDLAF